MLSSSLWLGLTFAASVLSDCVPCGEEGREWELRRRCGEEQWCIVRRLLPAAIICPVRCELIAETIAAMRQAFKQFRLLQNDIGAEYGFGRVMCPLAGRWDWEQCHPGLIGDVSDAIQCDIDRLNGLWALFRRRGRYDGAEDLDDWFDVDGRRGRWCGRRPCRRLAAEIFELLQQITCRLITLKRLVLACSGECRLLWAAKTISGDEDAALMAEFDNDEDSIIAGDVVQAEEAPVTINVAVTEAA